MSKQEKLNYKWSWKFKSAMLGSCAVLLYISYWMAGMADTEINVDIKGLVELVAKGSLYVSMLIVFIVLNILIFSRPNKSSFQWIKGKLGKGE